MYEMGKKADTNRKQKINFEQPMTYFFRLPKIKITEIEFEFGKQLKYSIAEHTYTGHGTTAEKKIDAASEPQNSASA